AVKRWPFWPEICRRITATGRDVIIVGTHDDRSEENWEDEFVSRFHMELPELAALLDVSSLYLGNDSGVGHVASAVGLPGLMLYGPSNPVKNAPNSSVMRTLVAPGEQGEERDVKAARPVPIERLTVEQVWREVEQLLQNPQRDPERALPQRVQDSPEARWEHYVRMTQAQPETTGIEERGQSPAGTVPKVSVVIPSYNRADNLERAVKSA